MMKKINKEENKKVIEFLLRATKRPHIEELILHMEENGFFDAPCSGKYHLCCEGGLAEHSLNVYYIMKADAKEKLGYNGCDDINNSIIICSLLHDLGKMGDYGKPNYVVNIIKDGKPTKAEPEQKYKQSEAEPFKTNKEIPYKDHEITSIKICNAFIDLTPEEEIAILWHNGLYGKFYNDIKNHETQLYMLLHFADMWASRVTEIENEECGLPFVTVGEEK